MCGVCFQIHVPLPQVTGHDSGSAASSAYAEQSSELRDVQESLRDQTPAYSAKRFKAHADRDWQPQAKAVAQGENSDADRDMGFNAFSGNLRPASMTSSPLKSRRSLHLRGLAPSEASQSMSGVPEHCSELSREARRKRPSSVVSDEPSEDGRESSQEPEAPAAVAAPAAANPGASRQTARQRRTPPPPQPTKAEKKKLDEVAKIRTMFESKREAFSPKNVWEHQIKDKAVQQMSKQMEKALDKILGSDDADHLKLVDDTLGFLEKSKQLVAVFTCVRKGYEWLRSPMDEVHMTCLGELPTSLLSEMFVFLAKDLLTKGRSTASAAEDGVRAGARVICLAHAQCKFCAPAGDGARRALLPVDFFPRARGQDRPQLEHVCASAGAEECFRGSKARVQPAVAAHGHVVGEIAAAT